MPNRILKESVCTSDSINALTWFEEVVFYRLIVNCDDYGRMDAREAILRAKLFPLKERISNRDIKNAVVRLADTGCVRLYECDSKPYLYLPNWESHQSIRAKKSRYPAPDGDCEGVRSNACNCNHMQSSACNCNHLHADVTEIQSESKYESEYEFKNTDAHALHTRFEHFWSAYPKKKAKKEAERAFCRLKPDDALLDVMLEALERQKQARQWNRDGGQYIPYPATWINGRRWEDEPDRDPPDKGGGEHGTFQGIDLGIDEL